MNETNTSPTLIEDIFEDRCSPAVVAQGPFRSRAPHWREDGTCSYCGGMRPSLILQAIREGAEVCPTDKSYKIYVTLPDPNVGQEKISGYANFRPEGAGWIKVDAALCQKFLRDDLRMGSWVMIHPCPATRQVKCYLNHFSESQALEFVRLHEAGKIKLGYPGHFYRPLAFGRYKDAINQLLAELKAEGTNGKNGNQGTDDAR